MLSPKVKQKLSVLTELPSIPAVLTAVLEEIDDESASAKSIASLIEQDQGLTARVLRVANSPFYGMARSISTIDLAIVILGTNSIREILIALFAQGIFQKVNSKTFDAKSFWRYSVFCGAASRFIARKLKYKLVSEAFVTGLMHDIGLMILMNLFRNNFAKVIRLQNEAGMSLTYAEELVFECTHCDVGAWLVEKWNFPEKIIKAMELHHTPFNSVGETEYTDEFVSKPIFSKLGYPLAAIVSMAEWLSFECGMKSWANNNIEPGYYISDEFILQMVDTEMLQHDSALVLVKQNVIDEYEKCSSVFSL